MWASASSEYWHIPVVGAYFKNQSEREATRRRLSVECRIRVWRCAVCGQMQACSWLVFCVSSERSEFAAERLGKAQGAVGVAVTLATIFFSDRWLLVGSLDASSGVFHLRSGPVKPVILTEFPDFIEAPAFRVTLCTSPTRRRGRGRLQSMECNDACRRRI